jgi:AcrR family transcriptional regulator
MAATGATAEAREAGRKGSRTRAAILDRAVDLASSEGLEALTIGRLAADIGMSKSGLFGHFGSKQELQLATVEAAADRFRQAVVEPAARAEPGAARLRALSEGYLDQLAAGIYPGGCFWGAVSTEYDDRPGPVRDAVAAAIETWLALLEHEARAAGAEDPAQLAFELHALTMGANARHRLSRDPGVFDLGRAGLERLYDELPSAAPSRGKR